MLSVMKKEYRDYKQEAPTLYKMLNFYRESISFRALITVRLMQMYTKKGKKFRATLCRNHLIKKYGFEIGFTTIIGDHLMVPHTNGIVLGKECSIGDNCKIYQNVTIGRKLNGYPQIGNNVTIYPGAVVIGPIKIGDNVIIGANAVVIHDLPNNAIAAGVPAKILRIEENFKGF